MSGIGEGIAFVGLCASATVLQVCGKPDAGLWLLVCVWLVCTDFGQKGERARDE